MADFLQSVGSDSLVRLINRHLTERSEEPPPSLGRVYRASGFHSLCLREEVLAALFRVTRTSEIDTDLRLIFDHGTALHYALQDLILPQVPGLLLGQWRCRACGSLHRKDQTLPREKSWVYGEPPNDWEPPPYAPWREIVTLRPERCLFCDAPGNVLSHEELLFQDPELKLSGHCDGVLDIPGRDGLGILEAKSIGNIWKVKKSPMFDHVIQAHVYMMFTGLQWAVILYWHKGTNGISAFQEHFVDRDEETIENIREAARRLNSGLQAVAEAHQAMEEASETESAGALPALVGLGVVPERICETADCKRALGCPVSDQCFGES